MKKLVLVESPTKVKTVSKYLGDEYTVLSTKGHIIDLPKKELGVDVEHDFEPTYVPMQGKQKVITELRKAAKDADEIYLATDLDREGEAISWHAYHALTQKKRKNVPEFHRVVFHEITKSAIEEAFGHPRELNLALVDAYQARRVLDRLVGYKLSPLLWKKIRYGLSAGRVQSVAVRLIVEREREREAFSAQKYFNIYANFSSEGENFSARLWQFSGSAVDQKKKIQLFAGDYTTTSSVFKKEKEVDKLLGEFLKHEFRVGSIEEEIKSRNPFPPLTTSRLQRGAVNRYGFTSKRAMRAAQKLYEAGLITYHRTDSVFLSDTFVQSARGYIEKSLGNNYIPSEPNVYKASAKNTQEAHEAIRPTEASRDPSHADILKQGEDEQKMYELIWKAALASQMVPAQLKHMRLDIYSDARLDMKKPLCIWRTTGVQVEFDGWMKIAGNTIEEATLPPVKQESALSANTVEKTEHETKAPPRYSEATLIKDLEKYGIGRPSTYAPTVDTIQQRKYVLKEGRYFIPTDTGMVVNDLLVQHFPDIVDLSFTAGMEEDLDKIADGEKQWVPVIREFFEPFEKRIEVKDAEIKKEDVVHLENLDEKCPECGNDLHVKLGKYGKFVSCKNFPECKYARPLTNDNGENGGENLDLTQISEKCPECGNDLTIKEGRFGKFIACSTYPDCKYTKNYMDKIGMTCPDCGEGDVVRKKTKRGREFFGCSRYPDCDFSSWQKPESAE